MQGAKRGPETNKVRCRERKRVNRSRKWREDSWKVGEIDHEDNAQWGRRGWPCRGAGGRGEW